MSEDDTITVTSTDELVETQASATLIGQLRKSKKVHDKFAEQFRTMYKISGKLMSEWKKYFKVSLPPDLNPQLAQGLDAKLMDLHQEASFYKAEADARAAAYKTANNERFRNQYSTLVTEYKAGGGKLPAKDTLENLANHAIADTKDGEVHAEIEQAFWAEVIKDLTNSRKLLEAAMMSYASEMKTLSSQKYIENLANKYGKDE